MKFIKDSIRELRHVVWPTKEETFKYFIVVNAILVLFGLYLFIFSFIFGEWITTLKEVVNPTNVNNASHNASIENIIPKEISTWNIEAVATPANSTWTVAPASSTWTVVVPETSTWTAN